MNREYKIGLLIFLLTVIVYANSLVNSFVWDDRYLIVENNLSKNWRNIPEFFTTQLYQGSGQDSNFYRPIQKLTVLFDYYLWGLNPFGYHITNILIHAFNAILVYILLNLLFKRKQISLISALFFAIHPIHTQAVTYISGRADLLAFLFIFLSLILFIQYRNLNNFKGYYWGAVLCFVFALLSRESAVILPFLLILYDISFNRNLVPITPRFKLKDWLSDYFPFLLLLSVYIVLRLTILDFSPSGLWSNQTNLYLRIITFGKVIFMYIRLLFSPFNLHMEYTMDWATSFFQSQILISDILLVILLLITILSYKYYKIFFFALAWFLLTLIPASNIILLNAVMAEHWLYVPSVGFFVIFSLGLLKLADFMKTPLIRKISLIVFLIPILVFYSVLTVRRNRDWKDELTLYQNTLKYSPNSARLHNNLGIVYTDMKDYEKAVKEFEEAIRLKHNYAKAYSNLGIVYHWQKRYEEAIKQYEKAMELAPNSPDIYNNWGATYLLLGKYDKALEKCKKALALREDYKDAHITLASAYSYRGEYDQAITHYKRAIEINPDYLDAYISLGVAYNLRGRYLETVDILNKAKRLKLGSSKLNNELGIAYKNLGEYEKAIREYKTALKLDPEYVQSYNNLGVVYSILGEYEEAIKLYKKAISLNPVLPQPYKLLGMAYLDIKNYKLAEESFKQAEKLGLPVQEYLEKLDKNYSDSEAEK